jgi:6-phosphofructokinase 1
VTLFIHRFEQTFMLPSQTSTATTRPKPTVAVLFSGGDAPGMNPLLRSLVRLGIKRFDATVLGIRDGFRGLIRLLRKRQEQDISAAACQAELFATSAREALGRRDMDVVRLLWDSVSGLTRAGGIVLGAGRCDEFLDYAVRRQALGMLAEVGVSALVVCGGNGSLAAAQTLAAESPLQILGIPATIDNDVSASELSLGADSAVNNLIHLVERITDTAAAHHRLFVLETMGRLCGHLARSAALACGVELVVTPERGPLDRPKIAAIAQRLERLLQHGRAHLIVLITEGVSVDPPSEGGPGLALAHSLQEHLRRSFPELEIRTNVLGHLQRGGAPSAADCLLAGEFADLAWQYLTDPNRPSGILAVRRGRIVLTPFGDRDPDGAGLAQKRYQVQKDVSKW